MSREEEAMKALEPCPFKLLVECWNRRAREAYRGSDAEDRRLADEEARDNIALIDWIADKIGLPKDEELSQVNFAEWLSSRGSGDGVRALDWSTFEQPKINWPNWKPDLQELVYAALNHLDHEGDADENAGEQIIERLLLVIRSLALPAMEEARALIDEAYNGHLGSTEDWDNRATAWLAASPPSPDKDRGS